MKKIVFGITNLEIGGAEKTLVDLCNNLCSKYEITIFTLYGKGNLEKNLNSKIHIINLYKNKFEDLNIFRKKFVSLKLFLKQNYIYKKYIKNKFDVEIAFLEGPITKLFSAKNNCVKKLAWIHTDISLIFGSGIKSKIKKIINQKIYNNYNELIFVSDSSLNSFNKTYNISVHKDVINNYIDITNILRKSKEPIDFTFDENTFNFLTIARLVKPKAIDRLIKIHSKLIKEGFYHKIYVIGDGPEKKNLEQELKKHQVDNTFILLGQKENPYPYIKNCTCFCLTSYYEGYGIVIEEAKALSKYILITDTASKEALKNYDNKLIIANNENSIYEAFKNIISTNYVENHVSEFNYNHNQIIEKIIEKIGD